MRKMLTTLVASAVIGATALSMSSPANAGWGWPFFWGGVAVGAIAPPTYGPGYSYGPGYYAPGYGCRPVWNGYAWVRGC